jgi:hypothetical protein
MTRARDVADTQDNLGGAVPPITAGKNAIYNSGFDIAQRGTSFTGLNGAAYALDRWIPWSTTGGQSNYASQESAGNLSVTPNQVIRYCIRYGRTAGTTNTGGRQLFQTLETADSVRFAGKTVTFSFYARAGANYSHTGNVLQFSVISGTGTDQVYYSFTGAASVISLTSVTLTTSWQRFTATGTVATNATQLATTFLWSPTGTAGAADFFEVTGVQLEEGSVATPYSRQNSTIQGELAACQRYYYRASGNSYSGLASITNYPFFGQQLATSSAQAYGVMQLPVPMRVYPTAIDAPSAGSFRLQNGSNYWGLSTLALDGSNIWASGTTVGLSANTGSGLTSNSYYFLTGNFASTAYIGVSAEL